eukprot:gnl/TRDRNA2_/TRDRNA2_70286_c0_seq1.p1 gnl/TRDRNA2_/TRDRNA2_70286_c0~~gnl/TRDRNA2_/TRDRNA2_70286_c0_seq1.p1  ORF type:complete len:251 (+),score=58.10 gnl/TRDRNA2_/TRDRNA2_70286_c0_seq1:110-862(+)
MMAPFSRGLLLVSLLAACFAKKAERSENNGPRSEPQFGQELPVMEIKGSVGFERIVTNSAKQMVFVAFIADRCEACIHASQSWRKAGDHFTKQDASVQFATADCGIQMNQEMCQELDIAKVPMFKYFTQASVNGTSYTGSYKLDAIKKFVKGKLKEPCNYATMEHCDKKEKDFVAEASTWDASKIKDEYLKLKAEIDTAQSNSTQWAQEFGKELDRQRTLGEEFKASVEAARNYHLETQYKVLILEQRVR